MGRLLAVRRRRGMEEEKNGPVLSVGVGEEKWRKEKEKEKIKIKMGVGICGRLEVWCWENRNGWRKKRKKKYERADHCLGSGSWGKTR